MRACVLAVFPGSYIVRFVMPAYAGIHDFCGCAMEKGGWVYIISNQPNGTLYTGVTSDLVRRISQHRIGEFDGFSKTHNLERLVYFERHDEILAAIAREKAMKAWKRAWKVRLIMAGNPDWDDLYEGIL
jgi:putative endonuclease